MYIFPQVIHRKYVEKNTRHDLKHTRNMNTCTRRCKSIVTDFIPLKNVSMSNQFAKKLRYKDLHRGCLYLLLNTQPEINCLFPTNLIVFHMNWTISSLLIFLLFQFLFPSCAVGLLQRPHSAVGKFAQASLSKLTQFTIPHFVFFCFSFSSHRKKCHPSVKRGKGRLKWMQSRTARRSNCKLLKTARRKVKDVFIAFMLHP